MGFSQQHTPDELRGVLHLFLERKAQEAFWILPAFHLSFGCLGAWHPKVLVETFINMDMETHLLKEIVTDCLLWNFINNDELFCHFSHLLLM